jgi:hypothetical protein
MIPALGISVARAAALYEYVRENIEIYPMVPSVVDDLIACCDVVYDDQNVLVGIGKASSPTRSGCVFVHIASRDLPKGVQHGRDDIRTIGAVADGHFLDFIAMTAACYVIGDCLTPGKAAEKTIGAVQTRKAKKTHTRAA